MSKFAIGQYDKGSLHVDLLKLVDTRLLVCANSGGGKSWLLRLIAERAANKVQTIILDPDGEFGTLREKLDILIVGEGGEVPIDVRSASLLARKLAELKVSAVIDLYGLDNWDDRRQYVAHFLDSLMSLPKTAWHAILIILDEAHRFAPESEGKTRRDDPVAFSRRAVNNLMSAGRKRGIAGLLATQRVSKLHKDAIAECRNVFIGNTVLDLDQVRSGDMLGFSKADRLALRDLEPGEFYAFGPALAAKGVVRFRSDQVETTHPKPGQRHSLEVPKATGALQAILDHLQDLPAQAAEEARTLEDLRRRNAELERELRIRPMQMQPKVERVVERVEVPVITNGTLDKMGLIANAFKEGMQIAGGALQGAGEIVSSFEQLIRNAQAMNVSIQAQFIARREARSAHQRSHAPASRPTVNAGQGRLPPARQNLLNVLAFLEDVGVAPAERTQLALLADRSPASSAYTNDLGGLRTAGLLDYPSPGRVGLTDHGRAVAQPPEIPMTTAELHEAMRRRLPPAKWRILEILIAHYPQPVRRGDIAKAIERDTGRNPEHSSAFTNNLGSLRSLGVIDYPAPGEVVALPVLFLD